MSQRFMVTKSMKLCLWNDNEVKRIRKSCYEEKEYFQKNNA